MKVPTSLRGRRGKGMAGHESPNDGASVEWYTPPGVFAALGLRFDLDPASPPGGLPWVPADRFLCPADNGLAQPWRGRVWLNPPYGRDTRAWMRRLASHGNGIALVFARTETDWFQEVAPTADGILFIRGRLTFVRGDGASTTSNAGAPSCLIAWGEQNALAIAASGLGLYVGGWTLYRGEEPV